MQLSRTDTVLKVVLLSITACFEPPAPVLVDGPTLTVEITAISEAAVVGTELTLDSRLMGPALAAHTEFLAANAGTIAPDHPLGIDGARVTVRPGNEVENVGDAFDGLMIFAAPESDRFARVFLASAVSLAAEASVELVPTANGTVYAEAQPIMTAANYVVGVVGPTKLGTNAVEFGLVIEIDLAIYDIAPREGGHF